MATKTAGSTSTSALTAVIHGAVSYGGAAGSGQLLIADIAAIAQAIKDDLNITHPVVMGAYSPHGQLFVPNRGLLKVMPGDVVAVDSRGWPILLSADTIANGPWTHS